MSSGNDLLQLDDIISRAHNLLESVNRNLGELAEHLTPRSRSRSRSRNQTVNQPTVSPEALNIIDGIQRTIQDTHNNLSLEENPNETDHSLTPVGHGNVHQNPESVIIDLCANSPDNDVVMIPSRLELRATGRRQRRLEEPEIIDLVSPARPTSRPISRTQRNLEGHFSPATNRDRSRSVIKIESTTNTSQDRGICPICLDSYISKNAMATKCGHIFCGSCIIQAINATPKCPICRKSIKRQSLIRLHF